MTLCFLGESAGGIDVPIEVDGDASREQMLTIGLVEHNGEILLQFSRDWPRDMTAAVLSVEHASAMASALEAALDRIGHPRS